MSLCFRPALPHIAILGTQGPHPCATYLVGERLTVADIVAAATLVPRDPRVSSGGRGGVHFVVT